MLSSFAPGQTILLQNKQSFELVRQLGRGAEGVVFLAHLREMGASATTTEQFALKFMPCGDASKPEKHIEDQSLAELALSGGMGERYVPENGLSSC
jgi:hypothetical protein